MTEHIKKNNNVPVNMVFSKLDFWGSFVAGLAIAFLSIPILYNIKLMDFFSAYTPPYLFLVFWVLSLPFLTTGGLYITHRFTVFMKPVFFEIGKYGIVGLLNTFLSGGIFNLLILATGVARGWLTTVFISVAFFVTTVHSFFWNKFWIFNTNGVHKSKREYAMFFIVTGVVSVINVILMHVLINIVGAPAGIDLKIWANITFVILIPAAFLGNFFGYKVFVFNTRLRKET